MNACQMIDSPIGPIRIDANDGGICAISMNVSLDSDVHQRTSSLTEQAAEQLKAYFDGQLTRFSLPLTPIGTDFQQSVWQQLQRIPYGDTCSYIDIARALGKPTAARAVGMANRSNPVAIVVPCHRVIGKNGRLTGYAGGLNNKQWLLNLEGTASR